MSQFHPTPPCWRAFERRWTELFWLIRWDFLGFWDDLGDELRERYERRTTTRGAVVRKWPTGRDAATQAAPQQADEAVQAQPLRRYANIQVRPCRYEVAVDTADLAEGAVTPAGERARAEPESPSRPEEAERRAALEETLEQEARRARSRERRERCWNCSSVAHFAVLCSEPRRAFCYRCGRPGHTVKTCPTCGSEWRSQGPYKPGCGHPGPEPPRKRGGRPGDPAV